MIVSDLHEENGFCRRLVLNLPRLCQSHRKTGKSIYLFLIIARCSGLESGESDLSSFPLYIEDIESVGPYELLLCWTCHKSTLRQFHAGEETC